MIEPRPPTDPLPMPRWSSSEGALVIYADLLGDLEDCRKRAASRLHALTADPADYDEKFGKGFADTREADRANALVEMLVTVEKQAERLLTNAMRRHPLHDWAQRTPGVGDKQLARLLAMIGDPYWHPVYERPRRVGQLWAYCGLHVIHSLGDSQNLSDGAQTGSHADQDMFAPHTGSVGVAPHRRRGVRANWNADARSRVWLIAMSCLKADGEPYVQTVGGVEAIRCRRRSPYRDVYDVARRKYEAATDAAGKPLTLTHQHNRAIRVVMKAILKDLWIEARALHADVDAFEAAS